MKKCHGTLYFIYLGKWKMLLISCQKISWGLSREMLQNSTALFLKQVASYSYDNETARMSTVQND